MKAYNKKRKPKHTIKAKWKVHFFKEIFWARYIVKSCKKYSVKGTRKMLKKKRFKHVNLKYSKHLFFYLNYKKKFANKYKNRII